MGAIVNSESSANNESLGVSSIQDVVPKYKRPRISAIRDYPPGCGRFATPIAEITGTMEDAGNDMTRRYFTRIRVSAIRDYPPFCGRSTSCPSYNTYNEVKSPQTKTNLDEQISPSYNKAIGKMVGDEEEKNEENIRQGEDCTKELVDGKEKHGEEKNRSKVVTDGDKCVAEMQQCLEKEAMRCSDKMNHREKLSKVSASQHHSRSEFGFLGKEARKRISHPIPIGEEGNKWLKVVASNRKGVRGPMAQSGLSSQGKATKHLSGGSSKKKVTEVDFFARLEKRKSATKTKREKNHSELEPFKKAPASSCCKDKMVSCDDDDDQLDQEHVDHLQLAHLPGYVEVNGFPPCGGGVRIDCGNNNSNGSRRKVKEALRLFQAVCRKLLHIDEANYNKETGKYRRVDLQAANLVKSANKYVNKDKKIVGSVPGVEVGDEFHYRVELNMIGLHHQIQGGIDYMKYKGKILATSIVASGGYADDLDNADVLIYTGQGGNVMNADKKPEDQKLERGNLALKNSCEIKNPVRVIRGSESKDGKTKVLVYDGLYVGERYWQDVGPHGKMVFRFQLFRMPGQPELAWNKLKKSKKLKKREGLIMEDISRGKEKIPICALNTIDDEKPPPFNYITRMIYPNWCNVTHPKGCNCTDGCLDSESCYCAVKNGGEIPYNHNGAIVKAKALVYECGPSCKCPPSCRNRVTQHGIKFQLEIFKTEKMGWGVRSLNSIPSGSFICEYIGELLSDTEAEKRAGSDEYLFDIGKNYTDNSVWDELSSLLPDDTHSSSSKGVEDNGFTIDAAHYGNVGRFINHSCSPNLYAQDVLYCHEDSRIPHVMLFAMDNIPPLQELTYHYNYVIDQVLDSQGNTKRKDCYCGSVQCTGRMY